jgi:hypothetical protein
VANKNAVSNYEQQFYLEGVQLSGVTNINGSYSITEEPINIIGQGYKYPVRQGPLVGNFGISRYYIGEDIFLNYTGDGSFAGSINYNDKSFGFNGGYLTEYSLSAGVGQIPTSDISIVVHGEIGAGVDSEGTLAHPAIQIPNQGSITLDCKGYQTNRVTSFSYTLRIDREPLYKIGQSSPIQVTRKCPLKQEATFEIECDDFEIQNIREYLIQPEQQDINLSFSNPIDDSLIETFTIQKARLLNQSLSSDGSDIMTVSLAYQGYINTK